MEEKELLLKIENLEKRVSLLEKQLETISQINQSEKVKEYIASAEKASKIAKLLDAATDRKPNDFQIENIAISDVLSSSPIMKKIDAAKEFVADIDSDVKMQIRENNKIINEYDVDFLFDYEIETGKILDNRFTVSELKDFVGNGMRITGYKGIRQERIIIPEKINGKPVVSIGERAFLNATFSEILLPSTLIAILENSFMGCHNLTELDLSSNLRVLGVGCFRDTGLKIINIPNSLKRIPSECFYGCKNLKISLPDSIEIIGEKSLYDTAIEIMIFPEGVRAVSHETFGGLRKVTCVFLGLDTIIGGTGIYNNVNLIYCRSASWIQKYALEHNIPTRPLSEFNADV